MVQARSGRRKNDTTTLGYKSASARTSKSTLIFAQPHNTTIYINLHHHHKTQKDKSCLIFTTIVKNSFIQIPVMYSYSRNKFQPKHSVQYLASLPRSSIPFFYSCKAFCQTYSCGNPTLNGKIQIFFVSPAI